MTWRNIVTQWALKRKDNLIIPDLVKELAHANIVPIRLINNVTLHSILLRQALLEILNFAVVPKAPQGSTFVHHMNAKEEMMWSFRRRIIEEIQAVEKETGMHLDHYYKLGIENMDVDGFT